MTESAALMASSPMASSYDLRLVALSIVLAVVSSYLALDLAARVTATSGYARFAWLLGGSCAMGIGIWSMHYIGMLAFVLPVSVEYHWPTVLLSLFAAILASAIALLVVSRPAMGRMQALAGSLLMGAGIATMHYVGMAAMVVEASCHWSPGLIVFSIVLAVGISFVALLLAFRFREDRSEQLSLKIASAVLMGAAIPVMHYTGMAAVHFSPSHLSQHPSFSVGINSLGTISILLVSTVTLALTLLLAMIDRRFSAQARDLEQSEQRHRELVESAQVVFWQYDTRLKRFTFVSHEAENLLGFPCSQWMNDAAFWETHIHPDDRKLVASNFETAVFKHASQPFECRMLARNGQEVWVRTAIRVAGNPDVAGHELVGSIFDITQRKKAEEALEEQRRRFTALMDASPECIYFKDLDSRFVHVNKAMTILFGLSHPSEAVGKTDSDFFAGVHVEQALRDEQDIIRTGKPLVDFEECETWPDGRLTWASTTKMPLRDSRDEICGTIGVSRNITERKRAQESLQIRTQELLKTNAELEQQMIQRRALEGQLVQAQKLESIGQLAAGVAHEINTPIQYVGDNCRFFADSFQQLDTILRQYQLLLENAKQAGTAPDLVSRIEKTQDEIHLDYLLDEVPRAITQSNEGVERVAHIVRAMKEFSHPGSVRMEAVDLNHALKSTLTVCRNEWKYVAEAVTKLDPSLPPVRCLAGEINQVFLNVVVNAAHAIADLKRESKGIITISTRLDGDVAEIRIADNGTGIPPSAQSRIFDPFFTTKDVGRGSGQGLAIARNVVVKKHRGTITFLTESDKGTEFIIRLPVAGVAAEDAPITSDFREDEVPVVL